VSGTGSADNASFEIVDGELRAKASFNFEGKRTHAIRVRSTDRGGLSFERRFLITVTNVDEAPTRIVLSRTAVAENEAAGATVGILSTVDPDRGDSFTYTLVPGAGDGDNHVFRIVGNEVRMEAAPDFESQRTYSVRIRSTDGSGLATEGVFTIAVTNVNEAPTAITLSRATVAENCPAGTLVGVLTAADPDLGSRFTYTLVPGEGDVDNAAFTVTGNRLHTAMTLDHETTPSRSIRVRVTDAGGLFTERMLTITVTNVNEAPAVSAPALFSVVEDVRSNLVWPAPGTPFSDVDSPTLTVTLSVADGVISATSGDGVTVGGRATGRTFSGTPAALNDYFRTIGRIGYTTAQNNTQSRVLTTTVSDGRLSTSATTSLMITPVEDPPTINARTILDGARSNTPFVITHELLRVASGAKDADGQPVQLTVQSLTAGSIERWDGQRWEAVMGGQSTSVIGQPEQATTQLLQPGDTIRWIPPTNRIGTVAAFSLRASDGINASALVSWVSIMLE
jgi:VCBS repeat-containing protein